MARYTGPTSRIARKFGEPIFGPDKVLAKKSYPPGQHGTQKRRGKQSEYGIQLAEKQKAKYTYGILEKQFSNLFKEALRRKGVTGENLLKMCEVRLDNIVYRLGIAPTRRAARQLVTHGQICIGDQKVTIPSYPVSRDEEELIRYHPRSKLNDENHVIRQTILGVRESAEYAEDEVDPEFSKSEATVVNESADDAPRAEDTVPEGGDE